MLSQNRECLPQVGQMLLHLLALYYHVINVGLHIPPVRHKGP